MKPLLTLLLLTTAALAQPQQAVSFCEAALARIDRGELDHLSDEKLIDLTCPLAAASTHQGAQAVCMKAITAIRDAIEKRYPDRQVNVHC